MARSKKCSRGKKYRKSYKRSNGKRVKGHCVKVSSRKSSKKVSRKRSRKSPRKQSQRRSPMCPPGLVWRKSHKRSSGKRVKGQCVRSPRKLRSFLSQPYVPVAPSAPEESKVFMARSLLPSRAEGELEMPPLESVKGEYGFGGGCGGYGFEYLGD